MNKITIHYDYKDGAEDDYYTIQSTQKKYNIHTVHFETHCLLFFKDFNLDVTILCEDGRYINNQELLKNTGEYTDKEIRKEHDVLKMFLAGAFRWK